MVVVVLVVVLVEVVVEVEVEVDVVVVVVVAAVEVVVAAVSVVWAQPSKLTTANRQQTAPKIIKRFFINVNPLIFLHFAVA